MRFEFVLPTYCASVVVKKKKMVAIWGLITGVLLVCLLVLSIPQRLYHFYKICKAVKTIPGLPTHWLWGNLHQFRNDETSYMKLLSFTQENNYKMTKAWIGPFFPVILISHSDVASKLLKLPKERYFYSYLVPWLGEGLLISKGKKWQRNRHLLTPAFHYQILKAYVPVVNSCLEIFLKKWTGVANDGVSVYAFKDVGKLSLDVIMRCAFSTESNCQLSEDHLYIKSISDMIHLLNDRIPNLIYNSDLIYGLTSDGKKFNQACKIAHNFTESVIRERKKALEIGDSEEKRETEAVLRRASKQRKYLDFLDILLTACDEDGKGLTDLEIRDEVDTFMFAGHDTTTSGISWTLYCLAKHPEHQDKIREEVRDILMGREWLEYDDLKELNYTQWCIKEAMRLYPPAPETLRTTTENIEIDGHVLPKGVSLSIIFFQIHRHPDLWENPNEYNPLNFHPSKAEGRDPYAYMPFSAGYRNCIGQNFAIIEEKMVIASIINRFQVILDEEHEVSMEPQIIMRAKNDIKIALHPINK